MKLPLVAALISIFITQLTLGQNLKEEIEQRFVEYAKDYPGVSITIFRGDELFWEKAYGYSNIEKQIEVDSNTKFNIYSTSKFITGLAFLKLTLENKINLEETLGDLDLKLPNDYSNITIGQLLNHTSGIRHYKGKKDWIKFSKMSCESTEDALDHFVNDPLLAEPGEKNVYTTFGMVMASCVLEEKTNLDFVSALNQILSLSKPLELDKPDAVKATPYVKKGSKMVIYPNLDASCKFGGGGLIASSYQLAEVGKKLYDGSIASVDQIKETFKAEWKPGENSGIAFGTGGGISNESFGQPDVFYIAMGGGSPGGRSYLFVVADLEMSVAITANMEGDGEDAYQLAYDIFLKTLNDQ